MFLGLLYKLLLFQLYDSGRVSEVKVIDRQASSRNRLVDLALVQIAPIVAPR